VLDAVATRAPRDLQELAEVRGMGPVRIERYGAAMLEALAARD
jgi:serine kinase of HPr protein (carbohydrate metabolism regulator)